MKRIAAFLLLLSLLVVSCSALSSCGRNGVISQYRAVGFVRSQSPTGASASFLSFSGRYVFDLRAAADGTIYYMARLDQGEMELSYVINGKKKQLCSVKAGDPVEASGGEIKKGDYVSVIMETISDAEEGAVTFRLTDSAEP